MPYELSDEEHARYLQLTKVVSGLQANPESRQHLERGLKVLNPQMTTSEEAVHAIQAPLLAQIEEMRAEQKRRDDEAAAAATKSAEDAALARMNDGFARLRSQYGVTDTGEAEVRKIMQERNIYDPEAAFALFEKQNPAPRPEHSSWVPDQWNYEQDLMPDSKKWFADPDGAADQAVGQVLLEMRRNGSGE